MSEVITALQKATRAGALSETAVHFAGLLERQDPTADPSVLLAGARAGVSIWCLAVSVDLAAPLNTEDVNVGVWRQPAHDNVTVAARPGPGGFTESCVSVTDSVCVTVCVCVCVSGSNN